MEQEKIDVFVSENPDWYIEDNTLTAGFEFADFKAVQEKIKAIMKIADEQDHHPTVTFGYNTIEVKTITHDAGDSITDKDFTLAAAVSKVVAGE